MKILQIVPSVSLVYGGPSQMVLGLSHALAQAGADVTLITTDANGDIAGQAPLDVPLETPIEQDGYNIIYFRCSPFRRYKFSTKLLRWLAEHAKEYDVAHIHALFSPISSMAATVARQQGLPYVLRPLGTLDPADLKKKQQLKKLYAAALEKPNLAHAAAVHFTTQQEATVSERFGVKTNDWVFPLGVVLPAQAATSPREKLGIPHDRPVILFMSRIDPKKGFDLLIPALENLVEADQAFDFVLAGGNPQDPDYENQIKQQIQASKFAQQAHLVGFVSGSEKTAWLETADVFVLPSYYENFGIAVAEAMTVATPVVISDQVHIWDKVKQADAGWVCECNIDSLTQTLKASLKDAADRQQRGSNAQKYALTHYSWGAIAKRMIAAYGSIGVTA
ncbi:glycosyltransferase [filamentous cyanobacterium LEGE 11480]|uniref:Glycosyltransferase n=1 Tax=Romeriopsis navalis LEGE 11480 TaxID=2777977 RepID=A0A928VSB1_9CYAN|nr:hormogonium polysaccharide biosynthesis glycosyltransferase HpsP [Romeriopsis navalis]MBE9032847.1 glycosyltransferase [Romeriopsis navalis LEGE 11480]